MISKQSVDALIAVHVFKLDGLDPLPYSTQVEASLLVWDKMAEQSPEIYQKFLDGIPSFIAGEVEMGRAIKALCEGIPPAEVCLAALGVMAPSSMR